MRLAPTLALAASLAACPAAGIASPATIVGRWAASPGDCGTQFAYKVGPRSLVTDDLSCSFDAVSRAGEAVTFDGTCDSGPGPVRETVRAVSKGGRLSVAFVRGGGKLDGLVRCPAVR